MQNEFDKNKLLKYLDEADYYKKNADYKSAIACYEEFLKIDNTKAAIYTITADLYSKLDGSSSLEKQIELYNRAYNLQNDNRLALHGLAFGYEKLGNNDKAKIFYEKLLQNNPTENDFYNYGAFLIHCGDFENGHKYFTHRFNIDDINFKYPSDRNKKWDLESDISDKTLLVHYEQGFGDTIMYSRFVPFLKKLAKKIIFVVQNELFDLISNSEIFDGIQITISESGINYDVNMALLDVPYVLKINSENLPYTSKYLNVSEEDTNNYAKNNINSNCDFKIGISLSGELSANYTGRDIEISKIYNLLKDIPNVKMFNLQKHCTENQDLTSLGNTFENFTQSACAVKNMDLIVSTDNVILNLAGALGVRTIGLFNKETNYRWFKTDGDDVGWYNSVKPLQAKIQNDWDYALSELRNIINKQLNKNNS